MNGKMGQSLASDFWGRVFGTGVWIFAALLIAGNQIFGSPLGFAKGAEPAPQDLRRIFVLGTNDIHGGILPKVNRFGKKVGGLSQLDGVVRSVRQGVEKKFGAKAGVLLVDAGDQFQGTLLSNFTEGALVFDAMSEIGYDAVVPGNHDYDFGPKGWLEDRITKPDQNPREVIESLAASARFPLISANTFFKSSVALQAGVQEKEVNGQCEVNGKSLTPIWEGKGAWRKPQFLKPYLIKEVAGVRVALVGLDHPLTPQMTTQENVSDLCFADLAVTYRSLRRFLDGKAEVFVIVMHYGNTSSDRGATDALQNFPEGSFDAVVSGHTHWTDRDTVLGAPLIQSGSGGEKFGRIEILYDANAKRVIRDETRAFAGVELGYEFCSSFSRVFCNDRNPSQVSYDGVEVSRSSALESRIEDARAKIAPFANEVLATAQSKLSRDRTGESPLANALVDVMRDVAKTELAFLNTGGVRTDLDAGPITYEEIFGVLPNNNQLVRFEALPVQNVVELMKRSVASCGSYGALIPSGLKARFKRVCRGQEGTAELLTLDTEKGETLFSAERGLLVPVMRVFSASTLDFLASGGSGYTAFQTEESPQILGIMREQVADALRKRPGNWAGRTDGRMTWVKE